MISVLSWENQNGLDRYARSVSTTAIAIRWMTVIAFVFLMDHVFTFWVTAWSMRATIDRRIWLVVLRVWPKWTSAERRAGLIRATKRSVAVRIILGLLARIIGVRAWDRHGVVPVAVIKIVVSADITRQFGAFQFVGISREDGGLKHFTAGGVNRVSNVGVQLGAAFSIADGASFVESATTLVAESASEMILGATVTTAVRQLPGRHGNKKAFCAFDDFQVADDKHVVEGDRTKRLKTFV